MTRMIIRGTTKIRMNPDWKARINANSTLAKIKVTIGLSGRDHIFLWELINLAEISNWKTSKFRRMDRDYLYKQVSLYHRRGALILE